ncbi:hypothetical protein BKA82DRAFT_4361667 [Pisolithus tinctorius]|nr:hypothetical protein BKA82DRAFT_4361667 [Pisolithus tinctorius]
MDTRQPQQPQQPDFSLPAFQGMVELAMIGANMSQEDAIEELGRCWDQNNPPGEPHPEDLPQPEGDQGNPPEEPPRPLAQPPAVGPECLLQRLPETNPPAFDPDTMVSSNLPTRPAKYTIKKIEAFKFVHMWYFTWEGLLEAAQTVRRLEENDTLAITQAGEGNVTLRTANSLTASKNAKPDHTLTFTEYMYAKNHFLMCIQNTGWGNQLVDAFNWFFHRIDNHRLRDRGDRGERALLHYASKVRQDWHDKAARNQAYNISTINEELLADIGQDLDTRDVQSGLDQVSRPISLSTQTSKR